MMRSAPAFLSIHRPGRAWRASLHTSGEKLHPTLQHQPRGKIRVFSETRARGAAQGQGSGCKPTQAYLGVNPLNTTGLRSEKTGCNDKRAHGDEGLLKSAPPHGRLYVFCHTAAKRMEGETRGRSPLRHHLSLPKKRGRPHLCFPRRWRRRSRHLVVLSAANRHVICSWLAPHRPSLQMLFVLLPPAQISAQKAAAKACKCICWNGWGFSGTQGNRGLGAGCLGKGCQNAPTGPVVERRARLMRPPPLPPPDFQHRGQRGLCL